MGHMGSPKTGQLAAAETHNLGCRSENLWSSCTRATFSKEEEEEEAREEGGEGRSRQDRCPPPLLGGGRVPHCRINCCSRNWCKFVLSLVTASHRSLAPSRPHSRPHSLSGLIACGLQIGCVGNVILLLCPEIRGRLYFLLKRPVGDIFISLGKDFVIRVSRALRARGSKFRFSTCFRIYDKH